MICVVEGWEGCSAVGVLMIGVGRVICSPSPSHISPTNSTPTSVITPDLVPTRKSSRIPKCSQHLKDFVCSNVTQNH